MKNFTSESVTEGHPDKLADKISDSFLDLTLSLADDKKDVKAAIETMLTGSKVVVAGEISRHLVDDVKKQSEKIVHNVLNEVGYTKDSLQKNIIDIEIVDELKPQSSELARAHEESDDGSELSGDQGMMHGFACLQTPVLMPAAISWAHDLAKRLTEVRKNKTLPYLRPDGKSQVTVEYSKGSPVRVHTVLLSNQHSADIDNETISNDLIEKVAKPTIPAELLKDTKFIVNPSGRFVIGGPVGDTGLTGRKIIVDTYGGMSRHGGGALSGKDPTKVDRSAAYASRWVAKNLVASGVADRVEVLVSYAIGIAAPTSIAVETFGTNKIPNVKIEELINTHFDLRPGAIIRDLELRNPIYQQTAAYGHFGRNDIDLPWERLNKSEAIRKDANL